LGVIAGLTVILCAVYMLRMYQKGMLGKPNGETFHFPDLQKSEWPALILLSAMVIGMGVYPQWIVELTEASSENILKIIKETVEGVS
ncbi:MAG: NADH-quinone oxidoreductase subunit M, partial [Bacteroidia bacterium]|nr:NADH-quinone oxidoreductase subunit M [Bacteroidia bacterium]